MSYMNINRITIKKDGVYLSYKVSNDSLPYRSERFDGLSEVYEQEGELGLTRELLTILNEYGTIKGKHKSVLKFKKFLGYYGYENCPFYNRIDNIRARRLDEVNAKYDALSEEDKKHLWRSEDELSPAQKEYKAFDKARTRQMYQELAEYFQEVA